jgi:uncharacterized phage protein (TIGR02218 family)
MVKSVSAAFQAHIEGEATTLADLWRVTRRDGVQFFFTDHDRDIVINVDDVTDTINADTYKAETGFTRTAIKNTANLSVDNMDVESLLDDTGITEVDVRAGKWDFAEIEIFMVNWDDITMGVMQLRRGFIGEVSIRDDIYFSELRGMVQVLQQVVGEVYTANCRADHGDSRCKFDISTTTETTEVESVTGSTNRKFVVPADFIGRNDLFEADDFFFSIGTKLDFTDDPSIGRVTVLKRPTVEDGTFRNPFILSTAQDVQDMNLDDLAWYALAANIDMVGFGLFTPIQRVGGGAWRGGLDGRGFAIENIDLDHNAVPIRTGLFDELATEGIIRRLRMDAPTARSGNGTTFAATLVAETSGTIEDCYVDGGSVTTDGNQAGGLIGVQTLGIIRRCWAAITISGAVGAQVGGMIGDQNGGTIVDCKQDTTVGITALGQGVDSTEIVVGTTAEMQDRVNWPEPTGTTVEEITASLPDRTESYDFFTVWDPPVVSTSRPTLRQWY